MRTLIAVLMLVSLVLFGCGQGGEENGAGNGDADPMVENGGGDAPDEMPEPPAGQRNHAELMQELVTVMSGVAETLNAITDVESAKAAIDPLEAAVDRLAKANEEAEAIGDPDPEVEKELEKEWMPKLDKVGMEFGMAMQKIQMNPEIAAVLQPVLQKLTTELE
jgi:hypothetical protein